MDESNLKSEMESFKLENENLKRENDRVTVDYELKMENLKKEVELKASNYDNLMKNYQEIEAKYRNSCNDKISLNQSYHDLSSEKFEIVKKFNTLETDYSTMTELISRRENELLIAKNEINELRIKIDEYKSGEIEVKLNAKDLEYRKKDIEKIEEMSLKRNKRLCEDIQILQDKLADLNKQLFEERSKNNNTVFDLNLELESKRNEIKNQRKLNDKLKENVSYLEKVYEEKTESLRSALEGKSNIDALLRKDLNAQKSMTELYKSERDELIQKQNTFIETITELQDAFRENCDECTKMKEEFEMKLEESECRVTDLRRSLNIKEKELHNANELLEKFRGKGMSEDDLKSLNPATAAAIGALKRGYSLTQIYSEYLQVATERNELKIEKDRLNEYLSTILEDIEERAPSIRKQQEERSHMELTVSTIGQRYERTLTDLFNYQSEAEQLRRKCNDLSKKLKREEQTTSDLSRQVCCLIREIETSRGTVIRSSGDSVRDNNQYFLANTMRSINQQSLLQQSHSSLISNNSSMVGTNRMTTANEVITTHLVTFTNIVELQQQNIKLLAQLRDLSEEQEAQEGLINEQSVEQIAKKFENARVEIDQLKEKVQHQRELEKIISRQRHIIQALTTLTGNTDLASLLTKTPLRLDCADDVSLSLVSYSDKDTSLVTTVDNQDELKQKIADYEKKLGALQAKINSLREEKDSLKDRHSKIVENLNKQINDIKVSNENLLQKLSFSQEKSTIFEQNLVNRQLELTDLQNDLSESNTDLAQKKEEVKSLKNELSANQLLIKNYENTINDMQRNMKHIETLEEQLRSERSMKYAIENSTNNLSAQIGDLRNLMALTRTENVTEEQQDLKTRIKQLSLELKQEKSKYQASQEMWQSKLNESSVKIDSLSAQLSTVGKSNGISSSDIRAPIENQKSPEKREKLNNFEEQIEDLTLDNKTLKKKLEEFNTILYTSESKLFANSQLMEQLQNEFQEKIDDEKKKSAELEEVLGNFQSVHDSLEIEYKSVKESLEGNIDKLETLISENNVTIQSLNDQVTKLKETETLLKNDLDRQRLLTKEAMNNYQQELIYHSQESDSLQEVNEQLLKYQTQERDLSHKLKEAALDRDQYKSDLEAKDLVWGQERESLEAEIQELRSQKESLNNRLIDLNDLVVNLKKMLDPTVEGAVDLALLQRESDWNEVIQYLRQEKENAENAKNQLEIDLYRLRNENNAQEETINQLNSAIEEERKFKMIEAEVGKQHAAVMTKLETVQMLTESNAMLRKDRERLKEELNDKLKKVTTLQEMLEPLKADLKSHQNNVETVRLQMRSLENERDLWRQRCDSLLEKSKQINPDDFRKLCAEKDSIHHSLIIEEEKCKKMQTTIDEMQQTISNQGESMREAEESLEEIRRMNDDSLNVIQKRDTMISQLKEIGRKYKAEKESLKAEIDKITEVKDGQGRELQSMRTELSLSKASLVESQQKLKSQSDSSTGQQADKYEQPKLTPENVMRQKIIENQLAQLKNENEILKSENEHLRNNISNSQRTSVNQDNNEDQSKSDDAILGDSSSQSQTSMTQSHIVPHNTPTVARVAANVHPVIQKPSVSSANNQISPSSMTVCSMTTARQTAEIRPIPAVIIHTPTSDQIEPITASSSTINTVSVTTSLPANVVQALANSSVSTVIFPSAAAPSASTVTMSTVTNPLRMKRRLNEDMLPSTSAIDQSQSSIFPALSDTISASPLSKKMRLRGDGGSKDEAFVTPVVEECASQSRMTEEEEDINDMLYMIDGPDVEIGDTGNNIEERQQNEGNDIDDVILDDGEEEQEDEDGGDGSMVEGENYCDEQSEEDYNEQDEDNSDDDDEDGNQDDDEEDDNGEEEDDEDDDDDEPVCITLSSSDEDSNDDGNNVDRGRQDDESVTEDGSNVKGTTDDEHGKVTPATTQSHETELEQARRKIEPITWTSESKYRQSVGGAASTSRTHAGQTNRQFTGKIGLPTKTFTQRRHKPPGASGASMARRNYHFGHGAMTTATMGGALSRGGTSRLSPFRGSFPRR